MRKFTLLFSILIIAVYSFAQKSLTHEAPNKPMKHVVEHYSMKDVMQNKDILNVGDTLYYESFAGGMPAGWTVVDNSGNNYVWIYSTEGPTGAYTGSWPNPDMPIQSTTYEDGFIMLPSDFYNTLPASGTINPNYINMDSYIKSAAIDCSADTSVMILFQEKFRYCCSSADAIFQFSVSNNGTTWYDYDIREGYNPNQESGDPELVKINITEHAAGFSTVYLKFYQGGASHYYWMIDDIALAVAPDIDSQVDEVYALSMADYSYGTDFDGFYSLRPLYQVSPIFLQADAFNFGSDMLLNVHLDVEVTNYSGATVFTDIDDTTQLSKDSIASLVAQNYFTPTDTGTYTAHYTISQSQVDNDPSNNTFDEEPFQITQNRTIARDLYRTVTLSPSQYVGGADGDFCGTTFYVYNADTVVSLTMYVSSSTTVGTTLIAQIYEWGETAFDDYTLKIESDERIIEAGDLGTWITVPLVPYNIGDDVLTANKSYVAGIEYYGITDPNDLLLGADDTRSHYFYNEARLRVGADWFWVSKVPCVRINFTSSILAPFFVSDPIVEAEQTCDYNYTIATQDPNGLGVTIELIEGPSFLDFNDNGDGTATLSGYIGNTLTVGDQYFVSLRVDNGTTYNEQNFYVEITALSGFCLGIQDVDLIPVSVFPNPAKDLLNITCPENSSIYIYNVVGELVRTVENTSRTNNVNVSGLTNGAYLVKVVSANNVYTQHVTILK